MTELQRRELEQSLRRDLEQFVRDEARSPLAARAAAVRGRLRLGALGAGAAARPRPRRRRHALREDRPDRRRPVQRARDRPGLQVGPVRALGGRDREGAAAADPALHARPARPRRDRAARRPLPPARRRAASRAACCAPRRRTTSCPGSSRTTTSTRTRSGRRSRARASSRAASRSGSAPATCATTRRGGRLSRLVRPLADVPGQARVSDRVPNDRAGGGDRGARPGLRLRRRRHRQDDRARRAVRRGGLRARARRRLDARDHVHGARRRRAARADPRAAARARPPRPRARARRRLDLDHPRLLPPAAEGAPVRGRPRPALPRARREPGPRPPRRGVRGGAGRVLRRRRAGAAAAARDLRRRPACAGC